MKVIVATFEDIKAWMDTALEGEKSLQELNKIYDLAMSRVVDRALSSLSTPPCEFAWFILGSGGRGELVSTSDQDHGIIFREQGHEVYFQQLGKGISDGLYALGFAYCEGKVMSSHREWCRSKEEWEQQISVWKHSEDLKDVRSMQMIIDLRVIFGSERMAAELNALIFPIQSDLLERLAMNMSLIKKGVTPLGQLIVDQHQRFDFKNCIYVPYVNSLRLLKLIDKVPHDKLYNEIMAFRLLGQSHIIVNSKNKAQLKSLVRLVKKLHSEVLTQIGIRC